MFIAWTILACSGILWLLRAMQKLRGQEGGQQRDGSAGRPPPRLRAELCTVACQSMPTWLGGAKGRYLPTRDVEQGAFLRELSIRQSMQLVARARDICAVRTADTVLR